MSPRAPRGMVYKCSVCGSEVAVVGTAMGKFAPVCCNQPMIAITRRLLFFRCPVCGAEVAVLAVRPGAFDPHCCNTKMIAEPAA